MMCKHIFFTGHAVRRMFERGLTRSDAIMVLEQGEVIADYPDDSPLPSCLKMAFVRGKAIHVVVAEDRAAETCHVVTAYHPDPDLWEPGFRTRRSS
jgi:hypothetical protein